MEAHTPIASIYSGKLRDEFRVPQRNSTRHPTPERFQYILAPTRGDGGGII